MSDNLTENALCLHIYKHESDFDTSAKKIVSIINFKAIPFTFKDYPSECGREEAGREYQRNFWESVIKYIGEMESS
jgi:hypothetical protein